ncbi:LysR family transcriptional regulator [Mesorhizobium sp. M0913]|uniref:helix-turn-helix domain-containing protein n=1 Tax=Mesorhizobium sp. M0913 TaxID=2957026 RepID=UPI0033350E7A
MSRIDDFEAFIAIVEHGSLTAAARRLNRSLQSVSRSLATLEESIGVRASAQDDTPLDAERSRSGLFPAHQARHRGN